MVTITCDNMIRVTGLDKKSKDEIKKSLSIANQIFWKMKKMGKYVGHISPEIKYYGEDRATGELVLPRGVRGRLRNYLASRGCNTTALGEPSSTTILPQVGEQELRIRLRDYQEGIVEQILSGGKEGVIRCGTGFGKSIIALKLYEVIKKQTLVIVTRSNLKAQFEEDIDKYFDKGYQEKHPIKVITIQALVRGISKETIDESFFNKFGLVICDECHQLVPEKSRTAIQRFASEYLYGFTATPRRSDGQGKAIDFIFGPVLVDRDLPQEKPSVTILEYPGHILAGEYPEIIRRQTEDVRRNELIITKISELVASGRRCLILTKRIEHFETILKGISGMEAGSVIALRSTGSAKSRATDLDNLRSGNTDFRVLLGTFSLLSTGVDIPSLDTLVIAGDLKSDVLSEQSIGRILRLHNGKQKPLVVDVWDTGNGVLKYQGKLRQGWYKEKGWKINESRLH